MATTNVIAHKNLTDPQLHEPKGISGASANTVYIANGTGSGVWGALPFTALSYVPPTVSAVSGYQNIGTITDVDYTVLTPVVDGTVEDATDVAGCNKNVKEVGTEVAQLRTELIKAFDNMAALKACLEDLRSNLISAGIISGS